MKYQEGMLKNDALKDKVIIVTGGGTGLGKSMSRYFLQTGAKVMICSRKEEVLKKTTEELQKETNGEISYSVCDVRKYEDVEKLFQATIDKLGSVNCLLNNAAGNFVMPTERLSAKAFDTVVDIVLKGTYNCTLAAGKYWIDKRVSGVILNIVTTYAFTGSGFVVPSAAAKGGVLALTRSLAAEWGKYGIRSNAIAPGPFQTEGAWSRLFPEPIREIVNPLKRIPLNRFGDHQELANLAAYLLSDFSSYVNGEVVVIDGGEWIHGAGQFTELEQIPAEIWDYWEKIRK